MKRFLMIVALAILSTIALAPFHTADSAHPSLPTSVDRATGPGWENATGRNLPGTVGVTDNVNAQAWASCFGGERPAGQVETTHRDPHSVPILHITNNYAVWTGNSVTTLKRTERYYNYDDWTLQTPKFRERIQKKSYNPLKFKVLVKNRRNLVLTPLRRIGIPVGGGHKLVVDAWIWDHFRMDPVPTFEVSTTPSGSYWRTLSCDVIKSESEIEGAFAGDDLHARHKWPQR